MKALYLSLLMTFSLLLGSCGDDDKKKDDPAPSGPVTVQVRMTQIGSQPSLVYLLSQPINSVTSSSQVFKAYDLEGNNRTETAGTFQRGQTIYLATLYVTGANYPPPTGNQYIQAEILVDGKVLTNYRIDASSYSQAAIYTDVPGGGGRHKMHETSIKL